MANKTVLIVDDSIVIRSALRRFFESCPGFDVSGEAENGQDAISQAERLNPDLIILDLAMPVMNGLAAAPVLKKMLPYAQLILFTAHDGHQIELLAKAAGIHAVVPKNETGFTLITQARALFTSLIPRERRFQQG